MCMLCYLKQFIYCYNHCRVHEYKSKLEIKKYLEDIGLIFVCYKSKLYIKDVQPNPKYLDENEFNFLIFLSQLIKEVNNENKKNKSIVSECKKNGVYFKEIQNNLYFEKVEPYEIITSFNYDNPKGIAYYDKYRNIYEEYKKNI
jgi:hypothetical protein